MADEEESLDDVDSGELARMLFQVVNEDFEGLVITWVLVADVLHNDGSRECSISSSADSPWYMDRGLLETALDSYKNIGMARVIVDGDPE